MKHFHCFSPPAVKEKLATSLSRTNGPREAIDYIGGTLRQLGKSYLKEAIN